MKNEEVISRINMAIMAMNNISVSGKTNLMNLSGSITILEDVISTLSRPAEPEDGSEE